MGGKTLYFGDIGKSAETFISYFERHGARKCQSKENPAEWLLEITGAARGFECTQDWHETWSNSDEFKAVKAELARLKSEGSGTSDGRADPDALLPFAASFSTQLRTVLARVFQQYWRTPSYLYSKAALCLFSVSSQDYFSL